MTTGQTDVQIVVNDQRKKLDGNICGKLHDEIGTRSWSVVDTPSTRIRDFIKELPEGDLTLCTPKLDAVLAYLPDENAQQLSALIFETNRPDEKDPRRAGEVMEQRLRDRRVSQVTREPFLSGDDRLEDPTNDEDAVVRRDIVAKLSSAIENQIGPLTKGDQVFVATTGGLAAANELINELVRLHSVNGPRVTSLEVPESKGEKSEERAVPEKFHPASGFRARWHALELIEKGSLLGAWGAVSHLKGEPGQDWTKVVESLALFASSMPLPDDCELKVLRHPKMAVRAALRVELALRAEDIPRAVHGTVAFFEAALWDWLRKRDFATDDGAAGSIQTGFTFQASQPDKTRFRFRKKDNVWRIDDFNAGIQAWLPILAKPALWALWKALTDDIRDLRNDVAHNEPTPELMQAACEQMQSAGLWSKSDPATFVRQPLVQDVLKEMDVNAPEALLQELLEEVRARLVMASTSPPQQNP
ncbi:MAG: hypothetical protein LBM75_11320 [Myxococcales bacterium]|nr:hypothetical protein [Myxococcales bacterium]